MSVTYIPVMLRRLVCERANDQCEYCLLPEIASFKIHCIDHIIAEKHGGVTAEENLAVSCFECNLRKGSDLASIDRDTGELVSLFHPRRQLWSSQFVVVGGRIEPLTQVAKVTIHLLRLNLPSRVEIRRVLFEDGLLVIPRNDTAH